MDRRLAQLFHDGLTVAEYEEERASMMQGIYCGLISVFFHCLRWPIYAGSKKKTCISATRNNSGGIGAKCERF